MNRDRLPSPRTWLLLLLLLQLFDLTGQDKRGSLTADFAKLSPKERIRIAERENDEAARDTVYQQLMLRGDSAFQAKDYETALHRFREARRIRPYNVYPKVKIEDLEALLDKRTSREEEDLPGTGPEPPAPKEADVPPAPVVEPSQTAETPAVILPPPMPAPAASVPASRTGIPAAAAEPVPRPTAPATPARETTPPALQTGERTYKKGNVLVTERIVEEDGRPVIYERMGHPWGQTFYFREGRSITEQSWNERFNAADR